MPDASRPAATPGRRERRSFGLWFETAPSAALAAVGIPSFFVLIEGIRITSDEPLPLVPAGGLGLVSVALISVAVGFVFARLRDAQQAARPIGPITVDVWRAVAAARLPEGADPATWRPPVEWYASEFGRAAHQSGAKLIGGLAFFAVGGFVISPHGPFRWIMLATVVALGIMILVKRRRVPRRLDALFAQLDALERRRTTSED